MTGNPSSDGVAFELSEALELLKAADELIESAPLHHYGKEYAAWQERRHDYFARRRAGMPESEAQCPRCDGDVNHIERYGQDSWECLACREWGPWEQATGKEPYGFRPEDGGV